MSDAVLHAFRDARPHQVAPLIQVDIITEPELFARARQRRGRCVEVPERGAEVSIVEEGSGTVIKLDEAAAQPTSRVDVPLPVRRVSEKRAVGSRIKVSGNQLGRESEAVHHRGNVDPGLEAQVFRPMEDLHHDGLSVDLPLAVHEGSTRNFPHFERNDVHSLRRVEVIKGLQRGKERSVSDVVRFQKVEVEPHLDSEAPIDVVQDDVPIDGPVHGFANRPDRERVEAGDTETMRHGVELQASARGSDAFEGIYIRIRPGIQDVAYLVKTKDVDVRVPGSDRGDRLRLRNNREYDFIGPRAQRLGHDRSRDCHGSERQQEGCENRYDDSIPHDTSLHPALAPDRDLCSSAFGESRSIVIFFVSGWHQAIDRCTTRRPFGSGGCWAPPADLARPTPGPSHSAKWHATMCLGRSSRMRGSSTSHSPGFARGHRG